MGKRSPAHVLWTEGPAAFSFLVEHHGFTGPHVIEPSGLHDHGGLRYDRANHSIEMGVWWWYQGERGVSTHVRSHEPPARVSLGDLYEACGLGPAREVPDGGGSGHVVRKRIGQHAEALHRILAIPHLDLDLVLRFQR